MSSKPRVIQRTATVVVAGLPVVALVGYLLLTNHASAIKVRENLLAQRANEANSRAAAVGHLLATAGEDVRYLAESREVAAYYESRDLGMSMEYGLALSLVPIRERLAALVQHGSTPGKFLRVAILDPSGAVIADSAPPNAARWPGDVRRAPDGKVLLAADGRHLVIARPLAFKGRQVALVVGWLRPEVVLEALGHTGSDSAVFLLDPRGRSFRPDRGPPAELPPAVRELPADGRMLEVRAAAGAPSQLAVRAPIPGQELTVAQVDHAEMLGDLSPAASALHLAIAACGVLGFFGLAAWLNTRSIVLATRLAESLRREKEVADKHAALEHEMAERQRLEEANAVLAMAVDQAAEGIAIVDERGAVDYANAAFRRMAACGGTFARGHALAEYFTLPNGADGSAPRLADALAGKQPWKGELRNHRADGAPMDAEVVTSPVHDADGRLVRHVVVARDVTEENHLREQLRHSQKLEAIGTLAGGVAHDFRNLLTVVRANSEFCLNGLPDAHPVRGDVLEILKAVERATELTRQLLAFSRRQVLSPEVLDVNAVVAEVDKMLLRLVGERVQLRGAPCTALPRVRADRGQLEQVLMNLAVNARDAMPNGGRLTIATGAVQLDDGEARRLGAPAPGEYVKLSVSDTGVGIDAKTLPRIFEPFFTTKPQGKGTGLGLATVYGIVQQSRGFLAVHSAPGAGATFEVYLPAAEQPLPAAVPVRTGVDPSATKRGDQTILVVEDEEQVRSALQRQLVAEGYSVLTAADGRAASTLLDEFPDRIDLLLSDVVMPHLGGPELARIFRGRHPGSAVVLMSGYSDEAVAHDGELEEAAAFVQKPYHLADLKLLLRRVLDSEGRAGRTPTMALH